MAHHIVDVAIAEGDAFRLAVAVIHVIGGFQVTGGNKRARTGVDLIGDLRRLPAAVIFLHYGLAVLIDGLDPAFGIAERCAQGIVAEICKDAFCCIGGRACLIKGFALEGTLITVPGILVN